MSSTLIEDVGKGLALGLPFGGPIGAVVGGLGGLLTHYAPDLLGSMSGKPVEQAMQAAEEAVKVVQAVTGTVDPGEAYKAAVDPEIEAKLRLGLAQVSADLRRSEIEAHEKAVAAQIEALDREHQAQVAMLSRRLDDVSDARKATADLVQSGSRMAWAPAIITGGVLSGFFALSAVILTRSIPQSEVALVLVGIIGAMGKDCVSYWTGSTASGADTRHQLVAMANKAADSVPPQVVHRIVDQDAPVVNVSQVAEANADRPFVQSKGRVR